MSFVYYVCEKCGEDFLGSIHARKILQCPYCGALAAFKCKNSNEAKMAMEAVIMRNRLSEQINKMKSGDYFP